MSKTVHKSKPYREETGPAGETEERVLYQVANIACDHNTFIERRADGSLTTLFSMSDTLHHALGSCDEEVEGPERGEVMRYWKEHMVPDVGVAPAAPARNELPGSAVAGPSAVSLPAVGDAAAVPNAEGDRFQRRLAVLKEFKPFEEHDPELGMMYRLGTAITNDMALRLISDDDFDACMDYFRKEVEERAKGARPEEVRASGGPEDAFRIGRSTGRSVLHADGRLFYMAPDEEAARSVCAALNLLAGNGQTHTGVHEGSPWGVIPRSGNSEQETAAVPDAEKELPPSAAAEMHRIGRVRWKEWDRYNGSQTHQHISAWRGGFRAGHHVGVSSAVPNAGTILGYFTRGPLKWMLTEREGGMLKGVDITSFGKVHTMHMAESSADVIVLINNDDYCLACWNTMPVGETCAVCGRVNTGER